MFKSSPKPSEKETQPSSRQVVQKKGSAALPFTDNRPQAVVQRQLQEMAHNSLLGKQQQGANPNVIQRVEISRKTVSAEVLDAFHQTHPFVQHLILTAEELPEFFSMNSKQQIQYFHIMGQAIPMLGQMIQAQSGQRMIAHQEDPSAKKPEPHLMNLLAFFELNPDFIQQSISVFKGGGATLHFPNPEGPVTFKVDNLRALMPPSIENISHSHQPLVLRNRTNAPVKIETEQERIERKKRQFTHPTFGDRQNNALRDIQEENAMRELLLKSFDTPSQEKLKNLPFHLLEVEHAKLTYAKGTLTAKDSMRKVDQPEFGSGITHIDAMRESRTFNPKVEYKAYMDRQNAKLEDEIMKALKPRLVLLSHKIRLTHYYDAESEESILDTGRLQSKERRIRKAKKGEKVPNKSGTLDDQLGNTDHVFFYGEYEESPEKQSVFRNSRFGGSPKVGDATLHQKGKLDGSERRVSFPLNAIPSVGMHGYLVDLNSQSGINPVDHVFSGMHLHKPKTEGSGGLPVASSSKPIKPMPKEEQEDPQGVHLLMDLLRQRFKKSNFPQSKPIENKMILELQNMALEDLYKFLFYKHPKVKTETGKVNPQILVPGSVPFSTPGVRFDSPSKL
ncbi:hypothetical protein [Flavobacterium sp.]|uniref:hypothetical protein n=1 Tax=Flavobacterium sp. TaxID=239 RepID=UPI0039E6D51B